MKILDNIKYILLSFGVLLIYMISCNLALDIRQKPMELELRAEVSTNMEIDNYKLYEDSLVLWDEHNLQFFDLNGKLLDQVLGNDYFTNVYLYNDDVLVLDKQLNVLYRYNTKGELEEKTDLEGPVFAIFNTDDGYFFHLKEEDGTRESIHEFGDSSPTYETNKFIIWYKSKGRVQILGEMTSEKYAYRSSALIEEGNRTERYNFDNETIIDLAKIGNKYMAVSNKNLYTLDKGKKNKLEIEKFKDYIIEDNSIGILTENTFTRYNNDLEIIEKHDLDISAQGVIKHQGGYFVYGSTDLIGFLGQDRQFKQKFNQIIYGIQGSGDRLALIYKDSAQIYDLVEIRNDNNARSLSDS